MSGNSSHKIGCQKPSLNNNYNLRRTFFDRRTFENAWVVKSTHVVMLEVMFPIDFTSLSRLSRNFQVSLKSADVSCVIKSSMGTETLDPDRYHIYLC